MTSSFFPMRPFTRTRFSSFEPFLISLQHDEKSFFERRVQNLRVCLMSVAGDSDTSTSYRRRRHKHRRNQHHQERSKGERKYVDEDGFRDALGSDNEREDEVTTTTTTTTTATASTSETETESASLSTGRTKRSNKDARSETQKSKKLVLSTLSLLVSMLSEHSTAEEISDAVQQKLRETVGTLNAVETLTAVATAASAASSPLVAPRKLVRPVVVASTPSPRSARFSATSGGGNGASGLAATTTPGNNDLRGSNELRKTALINASPRRATATPSPSSSPRTDGKEANASNSGGNGGNGGNNTTNSSALPLFISATVSAKKRPSATNTPRAGSPRSPRTPVDSLLESPRRFILYASPRRVNLSTVPIESPRLIGDGGSARVYEVRIRPGFLLAAKVYHQFFLPGDDRDMERRRMQRKLDALYALPDHPNVLPVLGYRFEDNRLIVLMERMDCSLRSIIDRKREEKHSESDSDDAERGKKERKNTVVAEPLFSAKEVLGLWRQVVNGVAFLHHLPAPVDVVSGGKVIGLWPRDVKSENVMCSRVDCEWQNVVAEKASTSAKALGAHKEWRLRLADFDESHIVYDEANPFSPIDWVEATQSTLQALQTTLAVSSSSSSSSSTAAGNGLEHAVSSPHPSAANAAASAASSSTAATTAPSAKLFPKISSMPSMSQFFASTSSLRSSGNVAKEDESAAAATATGAASVAAAVPASSGSSGSMTSGRRKGRNSIERLSRNVGTLQFTAPEMVDTETLVYDERVDVWSLGMVLFELLTGELPYGFDDYNSFQLYDIVRKGVRPSLPLGYLRNAQNANDDGDDDNNSGEKIWHDILQLFYECTSLEAAKRPTAARLLERIDALIGACK